MEDNARRVFISYSHADTAFANAFAAALTTYGLNVWKDDRDVLIGDAIVQSMYDGIRGASHFCCILSSSSMASEWVERELSFARERQRADARLKIVPVKIDAVAMPDHWRAYLWANLEDRELSIKSAEFLRVLKAFGTDLTEYHKQVLTGAARIQMLDACDDLQLRLVPFRELLSNYQRAEDAIKNAWSNRGYDKPRELGGRIRATTYGADYLIKEAEKTAEEVLHGLRHFARDLHKSLERFHAVWSRVDPKHDIESLRRTLSNDLELAAYISATISSSTGVASTWWAPDKLRQWLGDVPGIESAVQGARSLLREWAVFDPEASQ